MGGNMKIGVEKKEQSFSILEKIYNDIPRTKGCEKANSKNGCKAWCCLYESPSMFTCEFTYLWEKFEKKHSKDDQIKIVVEAVKNYLRSNMTKGCVFLDKEKSICLCHAGRCLSCRLYGIVSPKSWKKRKKSIREQSLHFDKSDKEYLFIVLDQCQLVKTIDGRKNVIPRKEQEWFEKTKEAENKFGIPLQVINQHDAPEGSYRSVHDHIMLNIFPEKYLLSLSQIRMNRLPEEEIEKFANSVRQNLEDVISV